MFDGFGVMSGRKVPMIKYFNPIVDENGYTHSIDNMVCWYYLKVKIEHVLERIHELKKDFVYLDYWEKLNLTPCVKYDYYLHHIHFGDIFIKLGRYRQNKGTDRKGLKSTDYHVIDCMRLEVNPNKHHDTPEWDAIMSLVDDTAADGYIDKYDYAIDIPVTPDKVVVTGTRKTPGLYNGTRYYGRRNQHGFVKIYDKYNERLREAKLIAKRLELPYLNVEDYHDCTRIETTLKNSQKFSSIEFGVVTGDVVDSMDKLTPTARMFAELLQDIVRLGGDPEPHLKRMNYRSRIAVEPYIYGSIKPFEFNPDILRQLLDGLKDVFHVEDVRFTVGSDMDEEYASGDFVDVGDEFMTPFGNLDADLLPIPGIDF